MYSYFSEVWLGMTIGEQKIAESFTGQGVHDYPLYMYKSSYNKSR
jgi:hypothetical protein